MLTAYGEIMRANCQMARPSGRQWDFWQKIANRIVKQAAADYQMALCGIKFEHTSANWEPEYALDELRNFFHSEWYSILTDLDGDILMRRLERECQEYGYDYRKIKKAHGGYEEDDD